MSAASDGEEVTRLTPASSPAARTGEMGEAVRRRCAYAGEVEPDGGQYMKPEKSGTAPMRRKHVLGIESSCQPGGLEQFHDRAAHGKRG